MSVLETEDNTPILGIFDYLRIIRERWLLGMALGILLGGLWTLRQLSQSPLYTSSVVMLVEILDDKVVDMEQVKDEQEFMARSSRADTLLNQHMIKMNSQEFRQYVIDSLTQSQVNRILDPYRSAERAAPNLNSILAGAFGISVNENALYYNISATHREPEVAAMIADTFAQQYIRFILSDVGTSNDSALTFLENEANNLETVIQREESELQDFRKTHGIVSIEVSQELAKSQLSQYESEQTRLSIEMQSLEVLVNQIEAAGDDLNLLLKIPEVIDYRNVAQYKLELDQARTEREQLSIDLLERHPRMIENASLIQEYEGLLAAEVDFGIKTLLATLDQLKAEYSANKELIATNAGEIQRLEELEIPYDALARSIQGNKNTLARIMDRLNETQIATQLSNANMRVIDSAYVPGKPSSPDMKKTIMVAAALFCLGFVGLPIGLNFIDDKLKTPFDVEQYLQKPLLGEILRFKKDRLDRIDRLVRDAEDELLVDVFRSVYNSVRLNDQAHTDKKIQVITSTIPSEGKTMFSMNYGAVVSQHGAKTLLVDCDLRKPRVEKYMGLEVDHGLVEWYNSNDPIPNGNLMGSRLGIQQVDANSFVLPAGRATNRSTQMVESERFKGLIERLGEEYDHIIIDSPPIAVFPDALFLAQYAQDVIYVSSYNRVARKTVKHFVDQLDKTNANVCGVVLNGRKGRRGDGGYGYNYGYNYQYASKYYGKYYSKD